MKPSNLLQCSTIYFIILANGISTFSKNKGTEDTHFELLASGSRRVTSLATKLNMSTCLPNEYGENCIYCVPHDSCIGGHYTCDKNTGFKLCMPGWYGSNCQYENGPEVNNYYLTCPESQCRNGGQCALNRCCCKPGFTGILCEIEIIECRNDSCANGGLCKDVVGNFTCICKPPFGGEYCERLIDTGPQTTTSRDSGCQKNTCKNNGRCFEDAYYTYCLCPTGFTGEHCETDLHSKIVANPNCPAHHFGENCEVICKPEDSCHGGHFLCDPSTGNKICLKGWIGKNCDTRLLPQHLDPICPRNLRCKNDGQCFHNECCCKHNYTGEICNVESIGCLSNPCVNNATCYPSGNGYRCECHHNNTGKQCETLINTLSSTKTLISPSSTLSMKLESSAPDIHHSMTLLKYTGTLISSLHISRTLPISSVVSKHSQTKLTVEASSLVLLPSSSHFYSPQPNSMHSLSTTPSVSSLLRNTVLHSSMTASAFAVTPTISNTISKNTYIPLSKSNLNVLTSNPVLETPLVTNSSSTTPFRTSSLDLSSISTEIGISKDNAPILTLASSKSQFIHSTLSPALSVSAHEIVSSPMSSSSLPIHFNSPSNYLSSTGSTLVNPLPSLIVTPNHTHFQVAQSSLLAGYTTSFESPTTTLKSWRLATDDLHISTALQTPSNSSLTTLANGSSIKPTSTSVSITSATVRVNNPDDHSEGGSKSSNGSLSWWVILLIVAGVLFGVAVLLVIVITRIQQRRSDSRTLERRPEQIQNYDKEHFSAQPDFKNQGYDVREDDSDEDSVKQDTYVVNE